MRGHKSPVGEAGTGSVTGSFRKKRRFGSWKDVVDKLSDNLITISDRGELSTTKLFNLNFSTTLQLITFSYH